MSEGSPIVPEAPTRPWWHSVAAILVMTAVLFGFSWLISGTLVDATIYAVFFLVGATLWSVFGVFRRRARERRLADEAAEDHQ